ncbi:sulfurtransferase [Rhodococcus sp. NPDC003318]|uniref:sulfurtransferase n=1 Tax=Rhodococcus sp. NPDC003318 TaxID=3364503 RepID=UPI00369828BA
MSVQPVIQAQDLAEQLGVPDAPVVLDGTVLLAPARFDGDYRPESGGALWRRAHVPGSRHVDLLTTLSDTAKALHFSRPSRAALARDLAALGIAADTPVVVYDQGGMTWAARVWWLLRGVGIDARVLDGGLARWTALGLPVESGDAPAAVPATVSADDLVDRGLWVDRTEVEDVSTGRAAGTLVCALAPAQFTGAEQTRYSRRGHIPGSRNLSAKTLLDDNGCVRGAEELRSLADAALADTERPLVIYCGGGVSACLTALGLVLSGHESVRVYDGSIEEWSADPSLPLVVTAGGDA